VSLEQAQQAQKSLALLERSERAKFFCKNNDPALFYTSTLLGIPSTSLGMVQGMVSKSNQNPEQIPRTKCCGCVEGFIPLKGGIFYVLIGSMP